MKAYRITVTFTAEEFQRIAAQAWTSERMKLLAPEPGVTMQRVVVRVTTEEYLDLWRAARKQCGPVIYWGERIAVARYLRLRLLQADGAYDAVMTDEKRATP